MPLKLIVNICFYNWNTSLINEFVGAVEGGPVNLPTNIQSCNLIILNLLTRNIVAGDVSNITISCKIFTI